MNYLAIKELKTQSGRVYFLYQDGPPVCLTAHFFDRYAERILQTKTRTETNAARDKAIRDWATSYVGTLHSGIVSKVNRNNMFEMPHPKGMCLGEKASELMIVKTFVSDSMLRDHQGATKEMLLDMSQNDGRSLFEKISDYYPNESVVQ